MAKCGKKVKKSFILQIQLEPVKFKFSLVKVRPLDEIEAEMIERRDTLLNAKKEGKPPKRESSWLCNYCSHFSKCYGKDNE